MITGIRTKFYPQPYLAQTLRQWGGVCEGDLWCPSEVGKFTFALTRLRSYPSVHIPTGKYPSTEEPGFTAWPINLKLNSETELAGTLKNVLRQRQALIYVIRTGPRNCVHRMVCQKSSPKLRHLKPISSLQRVLIIHLRTLKIRDSHTLYTNRTLPRR